MIRICNPHWNLMRGRIDDLALSHLVVDRHEMEAITERARAGIAEPDDFDPLLMANFIVWKNAIDEYGPENIGATIDEPCCPLCLHLDEGGSANAWINTACDTALSEARRLGLVPSLQ